MKLQAGIKVLKEIEGYGDPIQDSDRYDAVLKFYRNKGDPLEYETVLLLGIFRNSHPTQ